MGALRVVFMGTPDFSVPALVALIDADHEPCAVYSQPPRPTGRGHKTKPCPVHAAAQQRGIPVFTPKNLKDPQEQAAFVDLGGDVAVVVAYGLILPQPVLDAPRLGCVNIHASLLPRWRGAAPIQRAILADDQQTGVCVMQMEAGLDTGPVLARQSIPIHPRETGASLHDRLSDLGADMIAPTLADLAAGRLTPAPQPAAGATYAAKLDRTESRIDWRRSAIEIDRQIRAFTPWPGAWFERSGERTKVLEAKPVEGAPVEPGTVLDDHPTVACGAGGLRLLTLQRPGRGPVGGPAFLRGAPLPDMLSS